jgi:aminoglycoside phosphotransferase (APT) family kinase protein
MNSELTARLLESAINTLERSVVPDVKSDSAATMLDIVIRTLTMLKAHQGHREQDIKQLLNDALPLLDHRLINAPLNPVPPDASPGRAPLECLEIEKDIVNEQIADAIPSLMKATARDTDASDEAVALLKQIIDSQARFLRAQDPNIVQGSADVYRGGKIDRSNRVQEAKPETAISNGSLTEYLRHRFPDDPEISASAVNVLSGGFSKTTILFDMHTAADGCVGCVMRKDLSADFLMMEKTVVDEYPLIDKVFRAGLNVAEPLWLETDKSWFDGSFIVSRAVPGTSNINKWINNSGSVSQQLAGIMAELHGYDLSAMGFPPAIAEKTAGDAIRDEILHWQGLYEKYRTFRHPLLEIGFAWALQNIPGALFERPGRIVHGDIGFHNLMVDEGTVTALLDWEFGHFGAPAEDLVYVRPFVEQIADWDDFMENYLAAGGHAVTEEEERFYKVWSFVRNASGTRHAQYLFEHHLPDEIKLALPAWIHGFYLELDASKMVLDILTRDRKGVRP